MTSQPTPCACPRPQTAHLADGRTVCTWCRWWLIECEARHLLTLPLPERRQALDARQAKRGDISALKTAMQHLHRAGAARAEHG